MSYFKIGWLASVVGNANGIGDAIRKLDKAGIPATIACNDGVVGIADCLELMNAGSEVPHVLLYRVVRDGHETYAVPRDAHGRDYGGDPVRAAELYWAKLKPFIERETMVRQNKDKVWISIGNELSKENDGVINWIGRWATAVAKIANSQGYKVMCCGWAAGTPEPHHWRLPGMVEYLRYCASHRSMAGMALHEYSYDLSGDIDGHHIGRFRYLFAACDEMGIGRPLVIIKENGWARNKIPSQSVALDHIRAWADLYGPYDEVLGTTLWYLGHGWDGIANQVQRLIKPVTDMAIEWQGGQALPMPVPKETAANGDARVPYERTYLLMHESLTSEHEVGVFEEGRKKRRTFGFSADDAGIGVGLNSKTVELHHAGADVGSYKDFFARHYPSVTMTAVDHRVKAEVEPKPKTKPPAQGGGTALLGLHADARGGNISDEEAGVFKTARIEHVKILSSTSPQGISKIKAAVGNVPWVVRAFLDFGGRRISPQQFANDTIGDVVRSIQVIGRGDTVVELHNEPNLHAEGAGSNWRDGAEFANWLLAVLTIYRQRLPQYRMIFPGLSPGGTIAGQRLDHRRFWFDARAAIARCDGVAIHVYWSNPHYPMHGHPDSGTRLLDDSLTRLPKNTPVWITEASNNHGADWGQKGIDYVEFWRECRKRPQVQAVDYFVASAASGTFGHETWVGHGIGRIVGAR